jgi:phage gp45-like
MLDFMEVVRSMKNIIKRSVQTATADDSKDRQTLKVKFLGQIRDIKQVTPYGLYSSSPVGSEFIVLSARNNPDDLNGMGNDYKNRIKDLKQGEVALYNTITKALVHFKDDGSMYLYSRQGVKVETTGDIDLTGANINITGVLNINGVPYLTHTHSGVTVGAGSTGGVV